MRSHGAKVSDPTLLPDLRRYLPATRTAEIWQAQEPEIQMMVEREEGASDPGAGGDWKAVGKMRIFRVSEGWASVVFPPTEGEP